jgi:Lrp/AsnC family leucine-responsive transcriptional regulator
MILDEIDYKILKILQEDGKVSNQDLAGRVGLSPSPCLRRVRALEQSGVIRQYVALLDSGEIGLGLHAIVELRLEHQTRTAAQRLEKELSKYPQVLECYLMTGEWDYALHVVARDLDDYRDFCINCLSNLPGVGNVKSNISMKQVKYSTALLLDR